MSLRNLTDLDASELRLFFDSFDYVLCDCDGVVWYIDKPIPGAVEAILKLKAFGKHIKFVTNNSSLTLENYLKKFGSMGLDTKSEDVIYPTLAIIDYLESLSFNRSIYLIGSDAQREDLERSGFRVIDFDDNLELSKALDPKQIIHECLQDDPSVGAIIVDFDMYLSFAKLQKAATLLLRDDVHFIGGATDRNIFLDTGVYILGPGYVHSWLQEASKRKIDTFGKPSDNMVRFIQKRFESENPSRTLFIGDSLEQDISFAKKNGFQSLLVLSGSTKLEQAEKESEKAEYYIGGLEELNELMKKINL